MSNAEMLKSSVELYVPARCGCKGGTTKILEGASWLKSVDGNFPDLSISCDLEEGWHILIARGQIDGGIIPGKFHTGYSRLYIPSASREHAATSYEVLFVEDEDICHFAWIPSSHGKLVKNAVIGGVSAEAEKLYIGRFPYNGHHGLTWVPGKIQPSLQAACVSWGMNEWINKYYEILIGLPKSKSIPKNGKPANILHKETWKLPSNPDWAHYFSEVPIGDGQEVEEMSLGVETDDY